MSQNLEKIRKWLEPPVFPGDAERSEQAKIINVIVYYFWGALVLSAIQTPYLVPANERAAVVKTILSLLALVIISRFLLFRGGIDASSTLIAVPTWVICIVGAALSGGVSSPLMFSAGVISIIFGLLLRQFVGKVLIGMSVVAAAATVILPKFGWVVFPQLLHISDTGVLFALVLNLFFSGLTLNTTIRRLDDALKQTRRKAEETIVKSESMSRAIFDNIRDGMMFSDAESFISFRSPTYQRIDGYSNVEWSKFKQFELVHPEDLPLLERNWQAVLQNPAIPGQLEYRLRHKNGAWVWVESVFQNLLNDPDIRSIVITTRNIDERKHAEMALRRSEAKFRAVIENSNDGILFLDADNRIIYRSPSYMRLNGYSDEERIGRDGFDIVHPDDLEMLSQFWRRIKDVAGSRAVVEYRTSHKNGGWIWVESTLDNLLDDPDVGAIVLVSRDITERKHFEQAQAEAQAKMEKLFDVLPVGISVLNGKREVVKQNQTLSKILKLDPEELATGKHAERKYIRPDGSPMPSEEFASSRVLQGETSVLDVETGIIIENDEIIWVSVSATVVPFSDWLVVVVTRDITEHKKDELKLRESEERFRSLIEQSSDGIILTDESGIIIEWNRAQSKMTGIPPEKAMGMPVWEVQYQLLLPEKRSQASPETIKAGMQSVFSHGTSPYLNKYVEYEIEVDGRTRSFLQVSFPIKTEKGYRLGNITRDVTEIKQAEASLRQHDADVLNSALEERQRLARELHDSVGQVLGYVSFQTEAARELYASGKAAEADAQLVRLASIAQDAHADVREYILNLHTTPTSREPLFKTLQNYLDGFTRNYNIHTSLTVDEGLGDDIFDAKAQLNIFRIAQEGLSNVRKHAEARKVAVIFRLEGENVHMLIEDDGHGFDPESLLNDDKPHFGLRFMNERVEQLGGSIGFEPAQPSGTRVLVEIPIHKEKPS